MISTERRDKRGRRIGYNWWREYNVTLLRDAEMAWQGMRESGDPILTTRVPGADASTAYYQLSEAEYRMVKPRPTLKEYLLANAGMNTDPTSMV